MAARTRPQSEAGRPTWMASDLYDLDKLHAMQPGDWERVPGDDDPDEGETITLGAFLSALKLALDARLRGAA